MSEHGESERDIAESRRIANEIWANLIRPHEDELHDGEPCAQNRLGTIAFFAHVIGLRVMTHGHLILRAMHEYEIEHAQHGTETNGDTPHDT